MFNEQPIQFQNQWERISYEIYFGASIAWGFGLFIWFTALFWTREEHFNCNEDSFLILQKYKINLRLYKQQILSRLYAFLRLADVHNLQLIIK